MKALFIICVVLFTVTCHASPETVTFNGRILRKAPDSQEPTITIYRSQNQAADEQLEFGVTRLSSSAPDWEASRKALLNVVQRKATVLPLILHNTETDKFILVDFAIERPDLRCIEYVILKHYPTEGGELISIDARIRTSASRNEALKKLKERRDQLVNEFVALQAKLEV